MALHLDSLLSCVNLGIELLGIFIKHCLKIVSSLCIKDRGRAFEVDEPDYNLLEAHLLSGIVTKRPPKTKLITSWRRRRRSKSLFWT